MTFRSVNFRRLYRTACTVFAHSDYYYYYHYYYYLELEMNRKFFSNLQVSFVSHLHESFKT